MGGGAGGGGGGTGLIGALTAAFAAGRGAAFRAGLREAWLRFAVRAGLRAEVRVFLVTRRDLAMGMTIRIGNRLRRSRGTVANPVATGQDAVVTGAPNRLYDKIIAGSAGVYRAR